MKRVGKQFIKRIGRPQTYDNEKIKELIKSGKEDKDVAQEIGCSLKRVIDIRVKLGIVYTRGGQQKIDYVTAEKLYKQGKNDREIAEIVECSNRTISWWRRGRGLPSWRELNGRKQHELRL